MKLYLTAFFGLLPLNFIKIFFLRLLGHNISYKAKLGFSVLLVKEIILSDKAKIGSFNLIYINKVHVKQGGFIGSFNLLKGPIDLVLKTQAGISKFNKIRRANYPVIYDEATLELGNNSFIVSNHFLDLTRSIIIGDNSILAGIRSQLWTHGYYHADEGLDRIRIDGEINIGNNVYIGSSCIFNPGVKVHNAIHIGAGSVISKDLIEKGMYVGQGLRFISNNLDTVKSKLKKVKNDGLIETVYTK